MNTLKPVIAIDRREQLPLEFHELPTVRKTLTTGDYSIVGAEQLFTVERKSLDDLAASCVNSRREIFERELLRLRGYRFRRLLIIATEADIRAHKYRSNMTPNALLGSVNTFEVRYDVPLVWEPDVKAAARRIEQWAIRFAREVITDSFRISDAAKKASLSPL